MTLPQQVSARRIAVALLLLCSTIALIETPAPWRAAGQGGGSRVTTVSAASFAPILAPGSIAAAFGSGLATGVEAAASQPLPTTLAGTQVRVNGEAAPLFFVSPAQVNYLIPAGTPAGTVNISVTAGDGATSSGTAQIATVAPAIFTANANGQGVPAALLLRAAANGQQTYEPVARFEAVSGTFRPQPISFGAADEQVFLILFLSGVRNAPANAVRVLLGGQTLNPAFTGAVTGLTGLDQINVELPRSLAGSGLVALSVFAAGAPTSPISNEAEVEFAGATGDGAPQITGLSANTLLAGQELIISGANFAAAAAQNSVRILGDETQPEAQILEAVPGRLRVLVPFGASSGKIAIRTSLGEGVTAAPVTMRTSISGFVQDGRRQPIRGVRVRLIGANIAALTNAEGAFVLPDTPASNAAELEIDGSTAPGALPYPSQRVKMRVRANRDNQFNGYIELKQATGSSGTVGAGGAQALSTLAVWPAAASAPDGQIRTGQVILEVPDNATARFPNGATSGTLTLTVLESGRTPGTLPAGQFSPVIAQITPFGATITPGAKLTFPNPDGYAPNTRLKLFRFDQTPNSPTLGQFIEVGVNAVTVSADGQRIESTAGAVTETSYYFASGVRPTVTLIGRVVENNLNRTPVRRSLVNARGQGIFTDGNGGFVIRNVPINVSNALAAQLSGELVIAAGVGEVVIADDRIGVEADFMRPSTRVDRSQHEDVPPAANAPTISPDLVLSPVSANRAPTIFAPAQITMNAGTTREVEIFASDPDPGQTVQMAVSGANFATVSRGAADSFTLRLTPGANDGGNYTLTLTASDGQGGVSAESIRMRVNGVGVTADDKVVVVNRNTPTAITLTGSDPANRPLSFNIVAQPSRGVLIGMPPNVTYTPQRDYLGTDSFTFKARAGQAESNEATVTIQVRAANTAPVLLAPGAQNVTAGQLVELTITASDPDAGQTLTFSVTDKPEGATVDQSGPTSLRFTWTPAFTQAGIYKVKFTVTDNGSPALSDSREVSLAVDARWGRTSGPEGGWMLSLLRVGTALYAGSDGGGIYRSADNGRSWAPASDSPPSDGLSIAALAANGANLYAGTRNGKVFRSTDEGRRWVAASAGLPEATGPNGIALAVNETSLFAGTVGGGVFRSTDNGQTWVAINHGLTGGAQLVRALLAVGTSLYAGTFDGVFRTTDNGQNWSNVSEGLTDKYTYALAASGTTIYAGTSQGRIFSSTNQGQNWRPVNAEFRAQGLINSLLVAGANLFAGSQIGEMYRTNVNEQNWVRVNTGLPGFGGINALVSVADSVFTGTGDGVFVTANQGGAWTPASAGITNTSVFSLATINQHLFAGTERGVYVSTDNGQIWVAPNNGLTVRVNALAVIGSTLFAGVGVNDEAFVGVARSADQGRTWIPVNNGLPPTAAIFNRRIFSLIAAGETLYAGTRFGVYRSTNLGESWTSAGNGLRLEERVNALAAVGLNVFAAQGVIGPVGGVYRLLNGRWEQVNEGLPRVGFTSSLAALGDNLYVGTERGGVYRSTNLGGNWSEFNIGLPANAQVTTLLASGAHLYAALADGSVHLFHTQRQSWTPVSANPLSNTINALSETGTHLFAGTQGSGVFALTNNIQSWSDLGSGLPNARTESITVIDNILLTGTLGSGVFRSLDQGRGWSPANAGLPPDANVQSLVTNGVTLWAATFGDGIYTSDDQGTSWRAVNSGLGNRFVNELFVSGGILYAGAEGGVYRSLNGGANWTLINAGLGMLPVDSFAFLNGTVYAGTDGSGVFRLNGDGVSWTRKSNGLTSQQVRALGVNGNLLYAGTINGGICLSRDDGETWTAVNNQLPPTLNVYAFLMSGRKVYAGSIHGMFVTENEGRNWKQINAGLLNPFVTGLAVSGDQLFAATASNGVFSSRIPGDGNCAYSLTPASQSFPASGGMGSFNVATQSNCAWTATSNAFWITITAGANGNGDGRISYTVAANTSAERAGTVIISGQTFTVTQGGGCVYSLSPANQNFTGSGGINSVTVNAVSGCVWTAVSNASWIAINEGRSGNGFGRVGYSVEPNPGAARAGTLTIAGQNFTVTQERLNCSYSIAPLNQSFGAGGGNGRVNVTAPLGCAWTATSNASFLTITSIQYVIAGGTGDGWVEFAVASNTNSSQRVGTLTIAGQLVTVTQAGRT